MILLCNPIEHKRVESNRDDSKSALRKIMNVSYWNKSERLHNIILKSHLYASRCLQFLLLHLFLILFYCLLTIRLFMQGCTPYFLRSGKNRHNQRNGSFVSNKIWRSNEFTLNKNKEQEKWFVNKKDIGIPLARRPPWSHQSRNNKTTFSMWKMSSWTHDSKSKTVTNEQLFCVQI